MRTTAASLVALYIAFLLDLDNPKWAAMTVWIVAQSSRGMSLSKSRFRFIGTVVGAAVAVTLIALCAQMQELFVPALGLWVALCTAAATGWRNFRAYGAVLSGYTAVIISIDAITAPQNVFGIAVARVVYICLGIVTEALFTAVLAPSTPLSDICARLNAFLDRAAGLTAEALLGDIDLASRKGLIAEMLAIDVSAEFAAASYFPIRARFGHLRRAVTTGLSEVAAAESLRAHLKAHANMDEPLVDEAASLLEQRAAGKPSSGGSISLRSRIDSAMAAVDRSPAELVTLDRLDALLCALDVADESAAQFADEHGPPARVAFSFHVDRVAAFHNAVRSFVAVVAASVIWIGTAWSSGSGFVSILGVVCALFATRPNPVVGATTFLKGAIVAVLAATLCNFAILPLVTDFVPFAFVMALFMIAGGLAMRSGTRLAEPAASFSFLFLSLIGPDNTHRTSPAAFFNGSLALLMGVGAAVVVFALVFPFSPVNKRRRLWRAVRFDLAEIGHSPRRWSIERWLSRAADRVVQQTASYGGKLGEGAEADLRRLLSAQAIGDAALRLHGMSQFEPRLRKPVQVIMRRLGSPDPHRVAVAARVAASHLSSATMDPDAGDNRSMVRACALLREIAANASGLEIADSLQSDGRRPTRSTLTTTAAPR